MPCNEPNTDLENQNEQNLDMSASCCMEIAGIESMIPGVEAPKVGSMLGERE